MKLTEQITDYIHAAFSGLWIQSFEPDEAEREIVQHAFQKELEAGAQTPSRRIIRCRLRVSLSASSAWPS